MSGVAEQVELELGLDGGGVLRCSVSAVEAERLVQAFGRDSEELLRLETDRGVSSSTCGAWRISAS